MAIFQCLAKTSLFSLYSRNSLMRIFLVELYESIVHLLQVAGNNVKVEFVPIQFSGVQRCLGPLTAALSVA
jgi:multisubunit Na+/H+ antiporter MnhC subunit